MQCAAKPVVVGYQLALAVYGDGELFAKAGVVSLQGTDDLLVAFSRFDPWLYVCELGKGEGGHG